METIPNGPSPFTVGGSDMSITKTHWLNTHAAAGALAIVALLATSGLAKADAIVRQVSGTVEIGRGEPPMWGPLAVGARVAPNERVRTGGDGRVELSLDAATLRVHENSLLRLPAADAQIDRVELDSGLSLFDVTHREGHQFEVRTPTVVVSVKGTRFGVESDAEAGVVSVYRGVVGVRASDATEVVETLVHEGFLAMGGGAFPIELDVAPEGDAWSDWQDFQAGATQRSSAKPRESEVERARTTLRRAVDVDVVKRAAERKPEIADRLRKRVEDAKAAVLRDADSKDPASDDASAPASPGILDALDQVDDSQRQILDSTRAQDALEQVLTSIDTAGMTGGLPFPNGETTLSVDALTGVEPQEIIRLVDGLQDLQAAFDASPTAGTPTTFATDLESALVSDGMDQTAAQRLIDRLIGPLVR